MLLYANLIDNAVRHSPPATEFLVRACADSHALRTCVSDRGPGIPTEYRCKVLQRFIRLEAARTTPGNGLGLSLAHAVATVHDARLVLEDNQPGLRCVLSFERSPRTSEPAPAVPVAISRTVTG
jgi:signal transduction histidine kinase